MEELCNTGHLIRPANRGKRGLILSTLCSYISFAPTLSKAFSHSKLFFLPVMIVQDRVCAKVKVIKQKQELSIDHSLA